MTTIEEVITSLPKEWYWEIACPPQGLKGKLPYTNEKAKEKWRNVPYTVYVQNGKLFATQFYASATVDCVDVVEGLLKAIDIVRAKEIDLILAAEKVKLERKWK